MFERKHIAKIGDKIRQYTSGIILISIACLMANNILFIHPHKLLNGSIVFHSHPYSKSDESKNGQHQHTQDELLVIQGLNHQDYIQAEKFHLDRDVQYSYEHEVFLPQEYDSFVYGFESLRAPPAIS